MQTIEQVIEPAEVKAAPQAWRCIGAPFRQAQGPEPAEGEVSEQLDYEPARFVRLRLIRRKFIRRGELDAVPVIAPLPEKLQDRCLAAPGLLAQVVVAKYCDHLPLYRQERIYWTEEAEGTREAGGRASRATACICPGRRWLTGWVWQPTGSNPSTKPSAPESWVEAMCRARPPTSLPSPFLRLGG